MLACRPQAWVSSPAFCLWVWALCWGLGATMVWRANGPHHDMVLVAHEATAHAAVGWPGSVDHVGCMTRCLSVLKGVGSLEGAA